MNGMGIGCRTAYVGIQAHMLCMQVHLYLPGADHPAHDTVRAIVKDDTDKFTGDGSRVWLDSGECLMPAPCTSPS